MKEIMCSYRVAGKIPKGEYLIKGKGLQTALLILIRTLYGSSLIDNAGAYSPEIAIIKIYALLLSLLKLTEWEETY